MSLKQEGLVRFYEYSIDRANWVVQWQDQPIALNKKTFDLLLYFVDNRERVISKEELLEKLWPERFIEESNLSQHIFLLRKALSKHEADQKIIQNVPGRGYRFTCPVEEVEVPADRMVLSGTESITRITVEEEEDDSAAPSSLAQIRSGRADAYPSKRIAVIAVVAVAAVIALSIGSWLGWIHYMDRSGGAPMQVVLIPAEGTTGDPILDKSLTQALRMDLAQSPYVSVVPDSTVQATFTQMMHKPGDVMTPAMAREICERTNSQGVLSGHIAKVGQHFFITEEASNCVDGSVVAEAKYEAEKMEDLPHGIGKIAASLRQKLGESRSSIARFDMPLIPTNTASLAGC